MDAKASRSTVQSSTTKNPSANPEGAADKEEVFVPYVWEFVLDGEPFYASERVKPWRNN